MHGIDILTKIISNEVMMSEGKLPRFVLSEEEEFFLKSINSDIIDGQNYVNQNNTNSVQPILISNGETKRRIWKEVQRFISYTTGKEINEIVIGTNIKSTKDPVVPLYTVQWLLARLHEMGCTFKIYNPSKKRFLVGERFYHVTTIKRSFQDVDCYFDFNFVNISIKDILQNEDKIFSFINK